MNGWIKLHRKITEWEWYTDQNTLAVFIHLLIMANVEDKRYRGYDVKRGDCIIGRHKLAADLNMSEQNVRTAINHLISTNEITIKTTNQFSIVTICNYDSYQVIEKQGNQQTNQQGNQQPTNNQPTGNQRVTTPKEYKEYNKERMGEESIADKSATKKTLKDREFEFYNELVPYVEKYGKDMIRDFYNYWSQKTKNGNKMLWEKQKAFEIPKRLATWYSNDQKQDKQKKQDKNDRSLWQERLLREHEEELRKQHVI